MFMCLTLDVILINQCGPLVNEAWWSKWSTLQAVTQHVAVKILCVSLFAYITYSSLCVKTHFLPSLSAPSPFLLRLNHRACLHWSKRRVHWKHELGLHHGRREQERRRETRHCCASIYILPHTDSTSRILLWRALTFHSGISAAIIFLYTYQIKFVYCPTTAIAFIVSRDLFNHSICWMCSQILY